MNASALSQIAAKDTWPCRCGKLFYTAPEVLTATDAADAFDPIKLDM
jgi:hypothetical protein